MAMEKAAEQHAQLMDQLQKAQTFTHQVAEIVSSHLRAVTSWSFIAPPTLSPTHAVPSGHWLVLSEFGSARFGLCIGRPSGRAANATDGGQRAVPRSPTLAHSHI